MNSPPANRRPKAAAVGAVLWTALVAAVLLTSGSRVPSLEVPLWIPPLMLQWSDKVVHAVLFFGETFFLLRWLVLSERRRPRLTAALLAGGLALATETAQRWVPYRTADPEDLVANLAGVLLLLAFSRRLLPPAAALLLVALAPGGASAETLHAALAVEDGRVLARENATLPVTPGSVQKLVTAAAALHLLGPEHRFVTVLRGTGEVRDGVLHGDLVVVAGGDPTWSGRFHDGGATAPAAALAAQLRRRGVRRVAGGLVVDNRSFPGRPHPVSRSQSELGHGFSAPASGLAVDENCVTVRVAPGERVGVPARIQPRERAARITWTNRTRTVGRERHERGTFDFLPVWGEARVVVRGEYPISEPPYTLCISVPDPEVHAAVALRDGLRRAGVAVDGDAVKDNKGLGAPDGTRELARHVSPTLAEVLVPVLDRSHNWLAEMVLLEIARQKNGEARLDEALEEVERFLLGEIGAAPGSFVLDDGSGLSPHNLLTAETVVRLLDWARARSWHGVFRAALPRPGRGTLRGWPALGGVTVAKTGTVRGTVALAGYAGADGRTVFAVFRGHVIEQRRGADRGAEERDRERAAVAAWLREVLM
jgi:D-alanyl-D-alanine carboxypeptidase/D-alanyl-D-alanine-endopeptidase (penicillin-binding protein 4)